MSEPTPPIPNGTATKAGLVGALATFAGAVVAATQGLTVEAVAAVAVSGLTLLAVLGGRYAQAALTIKAAAGEAKPVVDAVASWELPLGENPDPKDAEVDHAAATPDVDKLLAEDGDYVYQDGAVPPLDQDQADPADLPFTGAASPEAAQVEPIPSADRDPEA